MTDLPATPVFPHDPDLEPVVPRPVFADDDGTAAAAAPDAALAADTVVVSPPPRIERANPSQWVATVTLARPLIVDGNLLDTITVRALTGQEFVDALIDSQGSERRLLEAIRPLSAGVHPAVLAALAADDYSAVIAAQRPFLPRLLQAEPDAAGYVADLTVAAPSA